MAYEHNWNPQDKLTYEQLIEVLTPMVVDLTENAFAFRKWSDDGGTVVEVYIEEGLQGKPTTPTPTMSGVASSLDELSNRIH